MKTEPVQSAIPPRWSRRLRVGGLFLLPFVLGCRSGSAAELLLLLLLCYAATGAVWLERLAAVPVRRRNLCGSLLLITFAMLMVAGHAVLTKGIAPPLPFGVGSLAILACLFIAGRRTLCTWMPNTARDRLRFRFGFAKLPAAPCRTITESEPSPLESVADAETEPQTLRLVALAEGLGDEEPVDDEFPEWLQQQWTRIRCPDGTERIEGQFRLDFAEGTAVTLLHLPLWPALPQTPEVDCFALDSESIRVRIAEAKPYGLRIEARRNTRLADGTESVIVGLTAGVEQQHAKAA